MKRKLATVAPETMVGVVETSAGNDGAVDPHPYLAGEVIGDRYRLVRELGRGGMGVVWVGYALALGVEVAVKLIRASGAGPGLSSRMAREAHAAARLGHPALVRVFDFGWTSRGDPFLVMELVQGETLSACLAREGRISAIRAVQTLLPVADGLRLAHDRTIVHRDIKPDNIFLATDSLSRVQPKLLDFGIAKVGRGNVDGRLTQVGVVLGSPEYMSPEQAVGIEDIDERTDIWSFAVVLYELVTGALPFKKANYNALMQAIIHDPVTPMTDFGGADEALWNVVARGLSKDRDERWPTMAEFGEALALWLYEHGIKEDVCGNSIRAVWLDGGHLGATLERVPTVSPAALVHRGASRRHSVTANTVERLASTRGRRLLQVLSQKRVSLYTAGVGAVVGGVLVASFLQGAPDAANASPSSEPLATPSSSAPAASLVRPPAPAASPNNKPMESPDLGGTPVENLPEARTSASSTSKTRASASSPSAARSGLKGSKKQHDFGF